MARRSKNTKRPVRPASTPAPRKGIPLSPVAMKMAHDIQLAGLSERTLESYLRAVRKFAQWLGKSPDTASEEDLRRYLHLSTVGEEIAVAKINTLMADRQGGEHV